MLSFADRIHNLLGAVHADFILLTTGQMQAYKRELVPESLPDDCLDCLSKIRVSRNGRTAIVVTALATPKGIIVNENPPHIMAIIETNRNPVIGYN